jgi:ABC-type nitrate/sulfonate/bicarbonate transport system substrate-binding protein
VRLRLGSFSRSLTSQVARARGLYAAHGLQVQESAVASSPAQFQALLAGELDLVLTSPDNVITYRVNASNPLGARADVRILRAVDGGLGLSLLARADVRGLEALRGATVGVDVPASGFAYALYALLARPGLRPGADYTVVALGSTPRRAVALREGRCAATLLNAGHDVRAEATGARRVARVVDALGPYLGTVVAASGPWVDDHPDQVGAFLQAWSEATEAVLDPAATDDLLAVVGAGEDLPDASADAILATVRSPTEGVRRYPAVPLDALRTVVDLRAAAAGGFDPGVDVEALRHGGAGLVDARHGAVTPTWVP